MVELEHALDRGLDALRSKPCPPQVHRKKSWVRGRHARHHAATRRIQKVGEKRLNPHLVSHGRVVPAAAGYGSQHPDRDLYSRMVNSEPGMGGSENRHHRKVHPARRRGENLQWIHGKCMKMLLSCLELHLPEVACLCKAVTPPFSTRLPALRGGLLLRARLPGRFDQLLLSLRPPSAAIEVVQEELLVCSLPGAVRDLQSSLNRLASGSCLRSLSHTRLQQEWMLSTLRERGPSGKCSGSRSKSA